MDVVPAQRVRRRGGKDHIQKATLACQPVQRIVAEDRFYAYPHSLMFLKICEHAPTAEHRRPGVCLHIHNKTLNKRRLTLPAAFTCKQLDDFISALQTMRAKMLAHNNALKDEDLSGAAVHPAT